MTEWLTYLEATRRLGVTPGTVREMLNRGDLVRRPGARDQDRRRRDPAVNAASVERLRATREQRRAERAAAAERAAIRGTPPDDEHVWLNDHAAAAVLRVSRSWVKLRAWEGRIPATKHGGRWWVRRDHAEQLARVRAAVDTWKEVPD